jgi:hypothetical protein
MKTYWGVEVQLHAFLTSALDGGEWSPLYPQGKSPWFPLDRRLSGLQSCSGHSGKERGSYIFIPYLQPFGREISELPPTRKNFKNNLDEK